MAALNDRIPYSAIIDRPPLRLPNGARSMIGISMGEIFNMGELASDCAADGVYEFFFSAPPLPITGAVGSPINPIAIK